MTTTRSKSFLKDVKRSPYRQSDLMRTKVVDYSIKTKKDEDMDDDEKTELWGMERVTSIIAEVIERITTDEKLRSGDHLGMTIYGGDLDYPINLCMRSYHSDAHHAKLLLNAIENVQQSKRDWMLGCALEISVTAVMDPKGRGKKPSTIMTDDLITHNISKGIFQVLRPQDNFCDVTLDTLHILRNNDGITMDEMKRRCEYVNSMTWEEVLVNWCSQNNQALMVLSQKNGLGTYHVKEWVSTHTSRDNTMILWHDIVKDKMYYVTSPNCIYRPGNHVLCFMCGVVYDKRSIHHKCSDVITILPYRVGIKRPHFKCNEYERSRKKSKVNDNEVENCLGRALHHAITNLKGTQLPPLQDWFAKMKMDDTWNKPSGLNEVKRWTTELNKQYVGANEKEIEVCIYNERERRVVASFNKINDGISIYLNLQDDHYEWIKAMPGWLGNSYFCTKCQKGYFKKTTHPCVRPCLRCECETDHYDFNVNRHVKCKSCNRIFWGNACYAIHLSTGICKTKVKCENCGVTYKLSKDIHTCYLYDCTICKEKDVMRGKHNCYVQPIEDEKDEERPFYVAFFDFETMCLEDHHIVNKVVVFLTCYECVHSIEDHENTGCVGMCGRHRMFTFETVEQFMEWLLGNQSRKHSMYTFLAHNLKGYDSYPILEYCVNHGIEPKCVKQGAKVLTMTIQDITFKDSLCFIPMALRKFPSTFGTSGGEKGYFPHFFNTITNSKYVGPFPELTFYGIDDMEQKEKEVLTKWWDEQKDKVFNLQEELTKYCIQDVMVMARGCLKFRELYVERFNVDPFAECVTIASTCLTVFKKNFLKHNTLGVVPPLGYRQRDIQSVEAMEWLHSLSIPNLIWSCQGGEVTLAGGKVDGYDESTNTVYQYHGCYWHGCNVCFKNRHQKHTLLGSTMLDLFEKTNDRTLSLRKKGHKVIEMWGHVWDQKMVENDPPPEWISNQMPIKPRDALRGGRTNATQLFAVCKSAYNVLDVFTNFELRERVTPVDKIRYADVVSLYPTVMWYELYPIGHPTLITYKDIPTVDECVMCILDGTWFGIVKCEMDPPRGLFFPVLPVLANSKLMFTLCTACSNSSELGECIHLDEERRINGVWTTCELKKAIEMGYVVHAVHEVWNYEKRSKELFKDYIRDNLKIKMEASGWPPHCKTDEEKLNFINEVKEEQGIELSYDKIIKNPGLRQVAKLNLNSIWGKFGQNPDRDKVKYVTDPEVYFSMLHDDTIQVKSVLLLNESMVQVTYRELHESVRANPNGNVIVASFVTSWARLRLYEKLELLGKRVVYHDTDSIIYTTTGNEEEIEIGDRLGQWSDECGNSKENWIEEFVSLGPKTYSYRTKKGEYVVKCKGISLTPGAKKVVHMKSMMSLLVNEQKKISVNYPRKIVRNTMTKQLHTVSMNKDLRLVYTKRQRQPLTVRTVPYGY